MYVCMYMYVISLSHHNSNKKHGKKTTQYNSKNNKCMWNILTFEKVASTYTIL